MKRDGRDESKMAHDIIVIGASAGGVEALRTLVAGLPGDLRASLFLVMHIPATLPSALPAILSRSGPLMARADQVLALLDDLRLPCTNNLTERDLRMAKVQQKISGTFRSATGATAFCHIRRYLSPMQKQGHSMLSALTAVFHGQPFPVAWGPE